MKDHLLYKQTFYETNLPEERFEPMPSCSRSNSLIQSTTHAPKMKPYGIIRNYIKNKIIYKHKLKSLILINYY